MHLETQVGQVLVAGTLREGLADGQHGCHHACAVQLALPLGSRGAQVAHEARHMLWGIQTKVGLCIMRPGMEQGLSLSNLSFDQSLDSPIEDA